MANTTEYVVTNESGTVTLSNLGKVAKFLGVKKVTKADLEAGKYPMVSLLESTTEEVSTDTTEEEEVSVPTDMEVPDDSTGFDPTPELDEATKRTLSLIEKAINDTPEEDEVLFSALCELEDAITEGIALTEEQGVLVTAILTGTLVTKPADPVLTDKEDEGVEDDTPVNDTEYPEVGDFKDEKAMKKFVKGLSDASLQEWCILEGAQWKECEHESINRMRMAMAIKAIHFPTTAPKAGKKSKSKYATYATEDLVQMALDNDVEVPDDKGDSRILRMYTIMALRKAGIID